MKTKPQDYIPFYGINSYSSRLIKARRSVTVEELQTQFLLSVYHGVICIVSMISAEKLISYLFN